MDIRIGQIKSIEKHPDADSLYVEQVRECVKEQEYIHSTKAGGSNNRGARGRQAWGRA
jgi:predicted RNA-binding protein with EMAP domain